MAQGRLISHSGEALVLRAWPFHEADLLLSLLTREQGVIKGVARHAMRSRRRFGGALEPGTHVVAHYTERPGEDLVRLDSFEILWSPLRAPVDALRLAGMQLVLEVLEQALPEMAPEDNVFRLALATLQAMEPGPGPSVQGSEAVGPGTEDGAENGGEGAGERGTSVWLSVTYFCLWMNRLMGWLPELGHCAACGLDVRGLEVWWSPGADGVTCGDDRRANSEGLAPASVAVALAMGRRSLPQMLAEGPWGQDEASDLRAFVVRSLERHLERRLGSAVAFV